MKKAIFFLFALMISVPVFSQGSLSDRPTQSVEEGKVAQGHEYLKALMNKHERLVKAIKINDAASTELMYQEALKEMNALVNILDSHQTSAPKFIESLNQAKKRNEMFHMAKLTENGRIASGALASLDILKEFNEFSTELLQSMKPVSTRKGSRN
jgi:hypothetical protein